MLGHYTKMYFTVIHMFAIEWSVFIQIDNRYILIAYMFRHYEVVFNGRNLQFSPIFKAALKSILLYEQWITSLCTVTGASCSDEPTENHQLSNLVSRQTHCSPPAQHQHPTNLAGEQRGALSSLRHGYFCQELVEPKTELICLFVVICQCCIQRLFYCPKVIKKQFMKLEAYL